jgi:radical SAM family RiPP maturation amino acid epimerase
MTFHAGTIRKILRNPPAAVSSRLSSLDDVQLVDRIRTVASLKRFFERYCADAHFRNLLGRDIPSTLRDFNLDAAPADVAAFLEANRAVEGTNPEFQNENLRAVRGFALECTGGLEIIEAAANSVNRPFRLWRERQLARLRFDFSQLGDNIVRPVVAFELSKGCTVGCWFCAISAERFGGNFAYGDGAEWRRNLSVLHDILGPAAAAAFCYWATDPLDNPDYERFALDLYREMGAFPPTTTALPLKNPQRTRELLQLSLSHGCRLNRFSVLTLPMLNRLHREFSAEELAFVEIVLQNPDALVFTAFPKTCPAVKIMAGKAMEEPVTAAARDAAFAPGTIACVAGFLINMVESTVRLVSPCMATEDWPLGYRVHDSSTFSDHTDLHTRLENMIQRHMPDSPPPDLRVQFLPGLQYVSLLDGFRLSSANHQVEFRDPWGRFGHNYRALGQLAKRGDLTAAEISAELLRSGSSPLQIEEAMGRLWQNGVLAETLPNSPSQLVLGPQPASERECHV